MPPQQRMDCMTEKRVCKSIRWLVGCFLLEDLLNLKGRRIEYLYRYPTYEKEIIKIMLAVLFLCE